MSETRVTLEEARESLRCFHGAYDSLEWSKHVDRMAAFIDQPPEDPEPVIRIGEDIILEGFGKTFVELIDRNGPIPIIGLGRLTEAPTKDPEAEVWKEIEEVRLALKEATQKQWNVDGCKNGKWGAYTLDHSSHNTKFGRIFTHKYTPGQLRDELAAKLREMVKPPEPPVPTLAEVAAITTSLRVEVSRRNHGTITPDELVLFERHISALRKQETDKQEAEEKLAIAEQLIEVNNATMRKLIADRTQCDEKLAEVEEQLTAEVADNLALRAELAEPEPPVVPKRYQTDVGALYCVMKEPSGCYRVFFASNRWCGWEKGIGGGIAEPFDTEREAQAALDNYVKENNWEKVT